jgi:hypothetical protein
MSGPPIPGGFVVTTTNDVLDHSKDKITRDTLKAIIAALQIPGIAPDDVTSIYISTFSQLATPPKSK